MSETGTQTTELLVDTPGDVPAPGLDPETESRLGEIATARTLARHVDDPKTARVLGTGAGGGALAELGFEHLSAVAVAELVRDDAPRG